MINILLRIFPFLFTVMALSVLAWTEAKSFVSLDVSTEEPFSSLVQGLLFVTAMFLILCGGGWILTWVILLLKKV